MLVVFCITSILLDEWSILPSLIFMGVGAMTDFGPLIANPKSFLLGAAAQLGIYVAYFLAIFLGFNGKAAAAISIIGGADGPTSIFLAGKLGQTASNGTDRGGGIFLYVTGSDHSAADHETSVQQRKNVRSRWNSFVRYPNWKRFLFPIVVTIVVCLTSSYNSSAGRYADAW